MKENFPLAYVFAVERAARVLGVALPPLPDHLDSSLETTDGKSWVKFDIYHIYHHVEGLAGSRARLQVQGTVRMHDGKVEGVEFTAFLIEAKKICLQGLDFLIEEPTDEEVACRQAFSGNTSSLAEVNRRANS